MEFIIMLLYQLLYCQLLLDGGATTGPRCNSRAANLHSHHHHQSLNHEAHWGTIDDFVTSVVPLSMFSTALWDLPLSRPVVCLPIPSFVCLVFFLTLYWVLHAGFDCLIVCWVLTPFA